MARNDPASTRRGLGNAKRIGKVFRMVKYFRPGVVDIQVSATATNKFRARVYEIGQGKPGAMYEVTVGGEEWIKGKGRAWRTEILDLVRTLARTLSGEALSLTMGLDAPRPEALNTPHETKHRIVVRAGRS